MEQKAELHRIVLKLLAEAVDRKEYKGEFPCPNCGGNVSYEINRVANNKNGIMARCKNRCFTLTT